MICPHCGQVVRWFGEDADSNPCEHVLAWGTFGNSFIVWENKNVKLKFREFCFKKSSAVDESILKYSNDLANCADWLLDDFAKEEGLICLWDEIEGFWYGNGAYALFTGIDGKIMELLDRYNALKMKISERKKSFDRFITLLEDETTWLISPASTRFHLAQERGLLKHSVGVAETLLRFREFLAPKISEESCIITGLFHDVGKLGAPGKPYYLPNDNEWMVKNRGICYKTNPEVITMGLTVRSLYLISQYISLSEAEAQAIAYHDGQYIDENEIVAHREEPLTLLIHWADYWTAHIYEEGRDKTL